MASDRIALRGLRVRGRHGVLAEERENGQEFVIDAVLKLDTRAAAASDALADTVDYGALAERLAGVVAGEPCDLIETLAQRLAAGCLSGDRVFEGEGAGHKPHAPIPPPLRGVAVAGGR